MHIQALTHFIFPPKFKTLASSSSSKCSSSMFRSLITLSLNYKLRLRLRIQLHNLNFLKTVGAKCKFVRNHKFIQCLDRDRKLNFPLADRKLNFGGFLLSGVLKINFSSWQMRNRGFTLSASDGESSNVDVGRKRKVVEHICLLTAKEDLSEEQEKDMLDFLYTTQYQMGGIIAISLGRISGSNAGNYTHAVFMRFQRKEDISKFYKNPFYLGVLKDHVMPYCHGKVDVDYESEVEDDILAIFRKGEDFNYGVEFILLLGFSENSLRGPAEVALASLARMTMEFPSLVVQATQGPIFNLSNDVYTHVAVIRFRSTQAFQIFIGSSEYKDLWSSLFEPISEKVLSVNYSVDPVGTEVM